jgi:hypothetical protein
LFFHISDVTPGMEPISGDAITHVVGKDSHGRAKAVEVALKAKLPRNLPKPTKRDAEKAQEQLTRVTIALRRLGKKVKPRRRKRGL